MNRDRTMRWLAAPAVALLVAVSSGCATGGDRLEVTDPLTALDRAELVEIDRMAELDDALEFRDGIATYGDPRWFLEFPAGRTCKGDEVHLTIEDGPDDDELVATVESHDVGGGCTDRPQTRVIVVVLDRAFEGATIVDLTIAE